MNFKLILTGKRASGKSTLLVWLLNNIPQEFSAKKINSHELSIEHKILPKPTIIEHKKGGD